MPRLATSIAPARADRELDDARWAAVVRRDRTADGTFVYGVRTTGVYCRPSCPSRTARRENVRFYADGTQARAAGLRACKRCRPDEEDTEAVNSARIARACRMIDEADEAPELAALATAAGLSPFHFHRVFRQVTGLTPAAYAAARRARRAAERLQAAGSVTEAIYDAGYGSASRFYAAAAPRLGMAPATYRRGGEGTVIRFAVGQCSLGAILVAATQGGVCAITLGDDPDALLRDLQDRFPRAELVGADPDFERTVALVVGLVEDPQRRVDLPLDVRGTAFQERVWQALREIPPGRTATYAEIAARVGRPAAVRAVAQACAANPAAVAIPCHRVVRTDGSLSGYRWGVERKRALLDREAVDDAVSAGAAS
ncbi:bifunctional DNA-binding transcriptional regulator/O6-methylguanine-DNA methyltransferase Ada [Alsobacter sp. R-9]